MTLRLIIAPIALTTAVSLAACAPVDGADGNAVAATPRQCLFQSDIRNFRVSEDGRNVYVRAGRQTVYRLETMGFCPDLENALAIGFKPRGGLSTLCVGDWTQVVPVVGSAPQAAPCSVRMTGALTEAEVAALPSRSRP